MGEAVTDDGVFLGWKVTVYDGSNSVAVTSQASGSHKLLRDNLRGPTGEWLGVNQNGQTY